MLIPTIFTKININFKQISSRNWLIKKLNGTYFHNLKPFRQQLTVLGIKEIRIQTHITEEHNVSIYNK